MNTTVSNPHAPSLQTWKEEGIIIIRNLLEKSHIPTLLALSDSILEYCTVHGHPAFDQKKRTPQSIALRHLNHPAFFQQHPERFSILMDLIADEKILAPVGDALEDKPLFRCTSLFMNPLELHSLRDGDWHRDTQFVTKTDEDEKVALFDPSFVTSIQFHIALLPSEDSQVVPGSHLRWNTAEEYQIRKADGKRNNTSNDMKGAVRFSLQPGDAIAFHPGTIHRGRYYHEVPRRNLMFTYTTTEGKQPADEFNYQPWFLQSGYLAPLSQKTRAFFQPFIETFRDSWKAQRPSA